MRDEFVKVEEIKPKSKGVNLVFKVVNIDEIRNVRSKKDRTPHAVTEALVGDETGVLSLTIWDEMLEKVEIGKYYELTNGYTELNDPVRQRELLESQAAELRAGFEEAQPMDEDFINALEIGMPPTGGIGMGVDRLIIALTGAGCIRDIIPFPIMKPEEADGKKDSKKEKS